MKSAGMWEKRQELKGLYEMQTTEIKLTNHITSKKTFIIYYPKHND